ncbi:MAG: RNA polymerase sigma factor [Planctomycetota bacterium]|jgi:RNA polymerase sigma-70 factor (ECF subfamily)
MQQSDTALSLEDLLGHDGFIRSLARSLLRDPAQVDDVVQQAWLKAMEAPPRDPGAVRAWLRKVVRRLALREKSAAEARSRREAIAAKPEATVSAATIVEREAMRQEVVEALLNLPDKYRDVLFLRYYEGLTPQEIAARQQMPAGTVRSLLTRGLQRLRKQLDRTHGGDRRSWALALIPLACPRLGATGATVGALITGVVLMKKSSMLAAATVVLAALGVGFWVNQTLASSALPPEEESGPETATEAGKAPAGDEQQADAANRVEVARARTGRGTAGQLTGRLLHADGRPAADVPYSVQKLGPHLQETGFVDLRQDDLGLGRAGPDSPRTDADGGWSIDAEAVSGGILFFDLQPALQEGFDLEEHQDGATIRLAPMSFYQVSCRGIGEEDRWQLQLDPGLWNPDSAEWLNGSLLRVREREAGRPSHLVLDWHRLDLQGPRPVSIPVVEGVPYELSAYGENFVVDNGDDDNRIVRRSPATMTFTTIRRCPEVRIKVVEPGSKQPSAVAGRIRITGPEGGDPHEVDLKDGEASLGWMKLQEECSYRVLLVTEDGEAFVDSFKVTEGWKPTAVHFTRGKGSASVRLPLAAGFSTSPDLKVFVLTEDGAFLTGLSILYYLDFKDLKGFKNRIGFRFLGDREILLQHDDLRWLEVWIVNKQGQVFHARKPGSGEVVEVRPIPTRTIQPLDIKNVYEQNNASGMAVFTLAMQLHGEHWFPLDRCIVPTEQATWPVWRKTVPQGFDLRLEIYIKDADRTLTIAIDR